MILASTATMTISPGSLVRARNREWVVLPESQDDLLVLRPLGGTDDEVTGILTSLEKVEPAQFDLPTADPRKTGDNTSCRLLRDATRLSVRAGAGPFRSFARIAVEPRPYQLVPLIMALRLDPVRLLIADDVGIGKTVEAALIARELLDRGEVKRLAVLCPPPLAEQWRDELRDKFHIQAEVVLPGTAARLERECLLGQSLFEVHPFTVVSLDFIKSDRRRAEFLRTCPEFVIVDEAHTCAFGGQTRGSRHQRYQLVADLSRDPTRHMVLVTATPHSGNENAFRSLLSLLDPEFADLPVDLSGPERQKLRSRLAAHLAQRRRIDIQHYMEANTPFPTRVEAEVSYKLTPEYKQFFDRALRYARETVMDRSGSQYRRRVRWWSALALLRALASSPAAAAATLRNRAAAADAQSAQEADELGRRSVLDLLDEESSEGMDVVPGSNIGDSTDGEDEAGQSLQRRLLDMARLASALDPSKDSKLQTAIKLIRGLIDDGCQPIVFCRFIQTAEYVAAALRKALPAAVEVSAVTGTLPPDEREQRVQALAQHDRRVLVATDCLSEGINLQDHFDAVFHYDLSWNPTRHEQREGRVDRYGQPSKQVRMLTFYGLDNQIDGIVLDALIRKHKAIRNDLGISVPVPVDADQVVEAIFEGLLLREQNSRVNEQQMLLFEDFFTLKKETLYADGEAALDREKRSRTLFAQESIKVDEVARELRAAQQAVGSGVDVAAFMRDALQAHGATVSVNGTMHVDLAHTPRALRESLGNVEHFTARFELPVRAHEIYLNRTHPLVEGLATYLIDTAIDPLGDGVARRCGAIRTSQVSRRTTLLLMRFRYHIVTAVEARPGASMQLPMPLLAEECYAPAFLGAPQSAQWLDDVEAEKLLALRPEG
ncbi:MAG: DEAD/DEAH box helicase, partial [Chloroflexi bacterium]|nr:DEAD/DEAH box helicase [Chloroflexota bacterium]